VCGLNIEFQEAESSRVMHLSCVVDRGEVRAAGWGVTHSPVRSVCLLRVESLGGQRNLVARMEEGLSRKL
jgi:hypothetical protein